MRCAALFGSLMFGLLLAGPALGDPEREGAKQALDKEDASNVGEPHNHKDGAATQAHDQHGTKKEDNPLAIYLDLGVWTVVVFVLLLIILRKLAWKPMLEGLQKREENIRSALVEAEKARAEAHRLQGYLDEQKAKMGEQVREAIDEARRDALRMRDEMVATAKQEIQAERDRLQRELSISKDQALKEIWNQAADLATLISAKTIRRSLTPDDHRRLVDEALTDFRTNASRRVKEVTKIM